MSKQYLKMSDAFVHDSVEALEQHIYAGYMSMCACEYAAHAINSHDELVEENERLRELERDAMRYRFLRECNWNESPLCAVVDPKKVIKLGADCPSTTRLDDFIDELMS